VDFPVRYVNVYERVLGRANGKIRLDIMIAYFRGIYFGNVIVQKWRFHSSKMGTWQIIYVFNHENLAAYLKTKQLRIWNSWSAWSTMVPEIGLSCSLPKKHQKTWVSFQVPARSQDIWTTWPLFFVQEKKWMRGPLFSLEPEAGPWIRITTYSLHVEDETFQALHIYIYIHVLHVYRQ